MENTMAYFFGCDQVDERVQLFQGAHLDRYDGLLVGTRHCLKSADVALCCLRPNDNHTTLSTRA